MVTPAFNPGQTVPYLDLAPQRTPDGEPNALTVGAHMGAQPLAPSSALLERLNLSDDPVVPRNDFATVEEGG